MTYEIPGFAEISELRLLDDSGGVIGEQGPATFGERKGNGEYSGPEQRTRHRRQTADRRTEVRFEPGKQERRSGIERRKGSWKSNSTI